MEDQINKHLVFLTENINNVTEILIYLRQGNVISAKEREEIELKGETTMGKTMELLKFMQKKNFPLEAYVDILRRTSNGHCADVIEENRNPKEIYHVQPKILKNKWWPVDKFRVKSPFKRRVGKKLVVEEVHDRILTDENRMVVICESAEVSKLTGTGGIRKTVTATWYAHHYEHEYDHVIWIDVGDRLLQCFQKLATDLDIKHLDKLLDLEDFSRKTYEALEEFKCLWIFDNTENYRGEGGIRKILPVEKRKFHCLITSKSNDWEIANINGYGQISRVELDIFGEEEAVQFFRVNLNEKVKWTESQLKELCRLLGYLPLTMQLAIAVLNMGEIDLKDYIEKTTTADDLDDIVDIAEFDGYGKTINKNIKIIMESIREKKGNSAYDILLICGYIRPDDIPKEFFKAILNIDDEEFNSAMKLLTKDSLMGQETKIINEEKHEVFNIDRLLQKAIRYNGRNTEEDTLRKILSCKGFLEYKIIPFTKFASEEMRKEFPKMKTELLDQNKLLRLLKEEKFEDSVELSKFMDKELRRRATKFNYAICLGKNGQMEDEIKILEELYDQEINMDEQVQSDALGFLDLWINMEMGLLNLEAKGEKNLIRGHLLVSHWKMDNRERVQEMLEETKFKMIPSQEMMTSLLRILKWNLINFNYILTWDGMSLINLVLGGDTKRIELKLCTVDVSALPNDLQELDFYEVELKNCESDNVNSDWLPKKLNTLAISISSEPIYRHDGSLIQNSCCPIFLSLESLSSIENITLQNCSLILNSLARISPRKFELQDVSFLKDGKELSNVKINEFVDFHQIKQLILNCQKNNIWIDLSKESANMEYLQLRNVTLLSLNSGNGKVNIKEIKVERCILDLSILPPSLEKFSLLRTTVFVSGAIDFPNLEYLNLDNASLLSHFRSINLTHLDLNGVKELNVDLLPPSTENIRIFRDFGGAIIRFMGGVIHLDKLILSGVPFNELERVLPHFRLQQLVLHDSYKPNDLSKLMDKQIPTIAIGLVLWRKDEFENSIISKQVDRQAQYYLLHKGTGKAIGMKDFDEFYSLEDIFY